MVNHSEVEVEVGILLLLLWTLFEAVLYYISSVFNVAKPCGTLDSAVYTSALKCKLITGEK